MFDDETPINTEVVTTGEKNIPTSIGDINISASKKEDKGNIQRSYGLTLEKNIKNVTLNANVENNNGEISHSENITYNLDTENISIKSTLNNNNDEINYNADLNIQKEFDNGVSTNTNFHKDNDETFVNVEIKKQLINPDNIAGIQNQDQERKEELVETGDRFNYQTKIGSSKDTGFYTKNSLMYRIDNNNFIKTDFNQNQNNSREIIATADLKKVKTEYSNTKTQNEEVKTTTNKINTTFKGKENQYNTSVVHTSTDIKTPNETITNKSLQIETGATLNRNEYGDFSSGFNGEIKTAISFDNGKFSGYNTSLDGAYNYYGNEHNSANDYLIRTRIDFGKQEDNKTFSTEISGAYRINNCNTIFEPSMQYSTNYSQETKTKQLSGNIGVFQNVGKNFGDAVVYTQLEAGKRWENNSTNQYINWNVGSKIKLSKKLTLNSNINYGSGGNFQGEIGGNFSF